MWRSGSVSLLADSINFFGNAGNYALSLVVLGMALQVRSRVALAKAACMGGLGVFVLGKALWTLRTGARPDLLVALVMAVLALTGAWSVVQHARREMRAA